MPNRIKINKREIAALSHHPAVRQAVEAQARAIRDEAKQLAPVETGALRSSIRVEQHNDEFRIGWDKDVAWYGPLVELGTERTAPQPHLRPAAFKVTGRRRVFRGP